MSQQQITQGAAVRPEMVSNAIQFLNDPSVNETSLTKKIEFLESKGMTNAEVQEALRQTQSSTQPTPQEKKLPPRDYSNSGPAQPNIPLYYSNPPPIPTESDWKDYVIMGTATAGLIYGAYQVLSRYALPRVLPPSQSKLEEDKEAMDREFSRVETMLEKLETDQNDFIKKQDEKSVKIDETLVEIDAIINKTNEKNLQNEETLKYLKLEIDSIKTTLIKSLDSQKLTLSNELQSFEKKINGLKDDLSNLSAPVASKKLINPSVEDFRASPSPPPNLLTNKSHSGNVPLTQSYLNIPPPAILPSAKDILKDSDLRTDPKEPDSEPSTNASSSTIPAWQLAANNSDKASIPTWQQAAGSDS